MFSNSPSILGDGSTATIPGGNHLARRPSGGLRRQCRFPAIVFGVGYRGEGRLSCSGNCYFFRSFHKMILKFLLKNTMMWLFMTRFLYKITSLNLMIMILYDFYGTFWDFSHRFSRMRPLATPSARPCGVARLQFKASQGNYTKHQYIYIYREYMQKYIHTHIHTYLPTYIPTYVHAYIHTCLHTYIRTYVHTYMHAYIPTYLPTYLPIYIYYMTYNTWCSRKKAIKIALVPSKLRGHGSLSLRWKGWTSLGRRRLLREEMGHQAPWMCTSRKGG